MLFKEQNNRLTDELLLDGIKSNDIEIIRYIYRKNYNKIKNMVNNFKYLSIQPEDVFQEGLTRAIINVKKGAFSGNSTFSTYLYSICRNICLKEYKQNKHLYLYEDMELKLEDDNDDYFEMLKSVLKAKETIDKTCSEIINLRFGFEGVAGKEDNMRFNVIAEKLNISPENARQKFGRCLKKLKKLISEFQTE